MIAVVGNALYEPRVDRMNSESAESPQECRSGSCGCRAVVWPNDVDRALEKKCRRRSARELGGL